jgi:hypothetical protein
MGMTGMSIPSMQDREMELNAISDAWYCGGGGTNHPTRNVLTRNFLNPHRIQQTCPPALRCAVFSF